MAFGFQSGAFQFGAFQQDGAGAGGWRGAAGEFYQRVGEDNPFLQVIPRKVERIIERAVKEVAPEKLQPVLEARIERAGVDWNDVYLRAAEKMQARQVATLAALRREITDELLAERLRVRRNNDAAALLLLLH